MSGLLTIDSQWIMESLNDMAEKLATLPAIEDHLARQNNSISKAVKAAEDLHDRISQTKEHMDLRIGALDLRISALERLEQTMALGAARREARRGTVFAVLLRLAEGALLAFIAAKMAGWV